MRKHDSALRRSGTGVAAEQAKAEAEQARQQAEAARADALAQQQAAQSQAPQAQQTAQQAEQARLSCRHTANGAEHHHATSYSAHDAATTIGTRANFEVVQEAEVANLVPAHETRRSSEAISADFCRLCSSCANCAPARPAMRPDLPPPDRLAA